VAAGQAKLHYKPLLDSVQHCYSLHNTGDASISAQLGMLLHYQF